MTLKRPTRIQLTITILAFLFVNLTLGQDLPVVKPEEVGFSANDWNELMRPSPAM